MTAPNPRSALDARTALCFHVERHSPGASESERSTAMRIFWIFILVAIAVGCAPHSNTRQMTADAGALDAAKVLAIAREAVATNDTWVAQAEFETPKRQPNGSWSVLVWRLPKTPGVHRFISIDLKGRITDYGGGL